MLPNSGAHSDPGSTDKAFQCLELQFLICKMGRDISALNNIPWLSYWHVETGC